MKIALVRGANLNKFEMQTFELLAEDFDITALCLKGNNFSIRDIKLPIKQLCGIDILVPQFLRRHYYFSLGFLLEINQPMFRLNKELRGFDIVHSSDLCYYYTYQAAKLKKKHGYKLVVTILENVPFLFGRNVFSRKRIAEIIRQADMFLPLTQRAAEALMLQGASADRIKVVPFGIDTTLFRPMDNVDELLYKHLDISREDVVILYVGRLSKWKGLFELIYAAKKIVEDKELSNRSVKFILVGDGPHKRKMMALLRYLELGRYFRIVGGIEYSRMPEIHNLADIFVLPSIAGFRAREQFGMVLVESMACGKPVVSTLTGSIPEVVGEAGLLVQSSDHYSLYQALKRLILDEGLRANLGQLARKRITENFDSKIVAQKLRDIYLSLLK